MFIPLRTARLIIRPFVPTDVDALHARRNDPEVARWQTWTLPYPLEKAQELVESVSAMDGPANDQWWMGVLALQETGEVVGDVAINLTWDSRCAEIGYTLARDHWSHGYAAEAATAVVEYLFEQVGVSRVAGSLHPDNLASAMVLERLGLIHEGHTLLSYWVGDDNSDDWIYGMTRADWVAWRTRPRTPPDELALAEIDSETSYDVFRLRTHKTQERFVAPMGASFTDALFPESVDGAPLVPWMRAITADGTPVGFVMLALTNPHHPEPYLWRLLIDRMHQRRGIGGRALDLVEDACRAMGDRALLTSWVPGRGSPEPFYLRRGYEPTGEIVDGEIEGRKPLA
ncbi:MAG: GNAT family N-acetyltransferase [Acidimicrobiia bacterium]